jgi:hypothetical protein
VGALRPGVQEGALRPGARLGGGCAGLGLLGAELLGFGRRGRVGWLGLVIFA